MVLGVVFVAFSIEERFGMRGLMWVALVFGLVGCAAGAKKTEEVASNQKAAYLAVSLSLSDGAAEILVLNDSIGRQHELAVRNPSFKVGEDQVFLFELDPKFVYAVTEARSGQWRTHLSQTNGKPLGQIDLQPGAITYIGGFMLWNSGDRYFVDGRYTPAQVDDMVATELKKRFPKHKLNVGHRK